MIELNLLPDVKQEFVRSQRLKRIIITSMILLSGSVVVIVLLIASYVYGAQMVRNNFANGDIEKYSKEMKESKNLTRNLTIQNQLTSLSEAYDSRVSMDRLFEYLKILNPQEPNNMKISEANVDTNTNTINLNVSTSSYLSISIIKDTFLNAKVAYVGPDPDDPTKTKHFKNVPLFESVDITEPNVGKDVSTGEVSASFKALLVYKPEIFASNINSPQVTVPDTNTTPSASRVSIFEPAAKKEEVAQ